MSNDLSYNCSSTFFHDSYYRAVTGDCHPCTLCCTDSKDWKEDIEKQCSEQSNLPTNQICRYDVNTIKCALVANSTSAAYASPAATSKPGGLQAMQDTAEGLKANTGLWLILVAALAVFTLCVLIGILVIYHHKKQLFQLLCGTSGCRPTPRKYPNLSLAYEIK